MKVKLLDKVNKILHTVIVYRYKGTRTRLKDRSISSKRANVATVGLLVQEIQFPTYHLNL